MCVETPFQCPLFEEGFTEMFLTAILTTQEQNEMSGSRGEANFVWKCKNCKVG